MSGASLVLFLLLDEPSDRATTWCYLPLGDEKAATLDGMTFDTMDHMMTTVHECFQAERPCSLVLHPVPDLPVGPPDGVGRRIRGRIDLLGTDRDLP